MDPCITCRFWQPPSENDVQGEAAPGECHRNAPHPAMDVANYESVGATWPKTLKSDWCGDHEWRDRHA